MLEQKHPQIQSGSQYLSTGDMAKIVMRYFVSQYSSQLFIVCLLEQTRCDVKLAAACIGGVNIRVLHDTNAYLF